MKNILKGFIIGIGKIIPGVSGAMLAISMGVYDKSIYYINTLNKNRKEAIKYLSPLGVGIIISIVIFSKIISYTLDKYYLYTMLFFIGLIIGGIPQILKKTQNKYNYLTIITFVFFTIITFTNINNNYILKSNIKDTLIFLLSGALEAIGTVVPGISSSALLLIIGTYNKIIYAIGDITNIVELINNIKIILPFSIGLILGIFLTVKLINYLLKKHETQTYNSILGILLSSIVLLILKTFKYKIALGNLIIGLPFLLIGLIISLLLEEK